MRSARIDTLRGIAVFGILLVNVWSFVYGNELPRYGVLEAHATGLDHAIVFFCAAFAEQKFYPIFAFLFGAGFALQTGGWKAPGPGRERVESRYRRRIRWLLFCGLLHGLLIWYGDILTTYALTGIWLAGKTGRRLRELVDSLQGVLIVNGLVLLAVAALLFSVSFSSGVDVSEMVADGQSAMLAYTQGDWLTATRLRVRDFGGSLASGVLFIPRIALFFLAGVFAVRLGWLTRPERHVRFWRRVAVVGFGFGLPLNLWWGYVAMRQSMDPFNAAPGTGFAMFLMDLAGPCMAAGYVAVLMLARDGMLARLSRVFAPVGRLALTNYLTQSLVCVIVLQGFGFGFGAAWSHTQLMGMVAAIMVVQLVWSRHWSAHYRQGPVEALWRAYTG